MRRTLLASAMLTTLSAGAAMAQCPAVLTACPAPSYNSVTAATVTGNVSNSTATATGATAARTLAAQAADHVNVANFGAALNGTTNDSTAFNNARAAAGSYTPIFVPPGGFDVPTPPTGGTSNPLLWQMSGNSAGTSTNNPVLSLGNSDSVQTFFSGTWFLGREASPANANPVMRIDLGQTATGGTNGDVVPGIQVNATQGAGSVTSVWGIQSILTSNAANDGSDWPEPVGIQTSVTKTASAALWGEQINLTDTQNANTSTAGGMTGLEIGYNASGGDSAQSRTLLSLIFAPNGSNPAGDIAYGILMNALNSEVVQPGISMNGTFQVGIDLSGITPVNTAIRLASGATIALEPSDTITVGWYNNKINLASGSTNLFSVDGSGNAAVGGTMQLQSYAYASLPGTGTAGREVFCTNCLKPGQTAGNGTGMIVFDDGHNEWVSTAGTVAAD